MVAGSYRGKGSTSFFSGALCPGESFGPLVCPLVRMSINLCSPSTLPNKSLGPIVP